MSKYYTGIGSRATPQTILTQMESIAQALAQRGYILRSGAADGADRAFEKGCDSVGGQKEIYLPWQYFNNHNSHLHKPSQASFDIVSKIHPAWSRLSFGAKKLHARNAFQVLGSDLLSPSDFVICWTHGGQLIGGTRTAIILAQSQNIPVYNLASETNITKIIEKLL